MKILLAHNYYTLPGGEDTVRVAEAGLLKANGHNVYQLVDNNQRIPAMGRLRLGAATVWSSTSYGRLTDLVRSTRADLVHFHNTFPLLSPSCYYGARRAGAAVVQTLHNYRLLCPSASMYRDGSTCEDCAGRHFAWPGVVHKCYRNSRAATLATATMLATHCAIGTWSNAVDAYIALTDFARDKFVSNGFPADKLFVKPNFLSDDPGPGSGHGGYGLFIGRLVEEKGVLTLLEAWEQIPEQPLHIVGDGPLAHEVSERLSRMPRATWYPRLDREAIWEQLKGASFLMVPSQCYEGLPLVLIEACASGCPVLASNIGGLPSVVKDNVTGLLFNPADPGDLCGKIRRIRPELPRMRRAARAEFEAKYTAERNYGMLMDIYAKAIASARAATQPVPQQSCEPVG